MTRLRITFLALALLLSTRAHSQEQPEWEIVPLNDSGLAEYDENTGLLTLTNGVRLTYGGDILNANSLAFNVHTGDALADGAVRILRNDLIWAGEHIRYNVNSRVIEAEQFRTGKWPVFISAQGLHADPTNNVYFATNAFIATDDVANPSLRVRARRIKIIPGDKVVAYDATVYAGNVPVFYFPIYSRKLGINANNLNFIPGYRNHFGPFILGTYTWFLNEQLHGAFHVDYRQRRGVAAGPDLNYQLGKWGEGYLKYYYALDQDPNAETPLPRIPENRQRLNFAYHSSPATNLYVKSVVRYESDSRVVRDFFEGEYRQNIQPNTFVEANHFWQNFNLDAYVQPQVNDFLDTVERLPDIKLTGYRQQIGNSPLYYESESSAGYYRRIFAETNGAPLFPEYSAARADTYHQILYPNTLFGWLNLTPRVGGRFTYYSEASGPSTTTDETYRRVFNTGAEVSFKASRVWPALKSEFFQLDGLRHIVEPSVNYVYVPTPNERPPDLPQFDYQLQSLRLLPIEFPDFNAIDSIDSQNVLRLGLRNKLQTKRMNQVVNFADWNVYTDWRLDKLNGQTTFDDVYSDLVMRPRSWLTWESLERFNVDSGNFRMALNTVTIQPGPTWSWSGANYYFHDDFRPLPEGLGLGNNLFLSTIFYHLNENWAFSATHRFEARDGRLEEQRYTFYRDFRSWTAALSFRFRDNRVGDDDFTIAFTFSFKAQPRYGLGADTLRPYSLLGS
jgi:lipopolysaccharide assembly outer membrane protein LptD (OstA)